MEHYLPFLLFWAFFNSLTLREASGFCSSLLWHGFFIFRISSWPAPCFWKMLVLFSECSFNLILMVSINIISRWRTVCHKTCTRDTTLPFLREKLLIGISERFKNVEESCTSSAIYLIWALSKRALFPAKQYWAINNVMHPTEKQTFVLLQEKKY